MRHTVKLSLVFMIQHTVLSGTWRTFLCKKYTYLSPNENASVTGLEFFIAADDY